MRRYLIKELFENTSCSPYGQTFSYSKELAKISEYDLPLQYPPHKLNIFYDKEEASQFQKRVP